MRSKFNPILPQVEMIEQLDLKLVNLTLSGFGMGSVFRLWHMPVKSHFLHRFSISKEMNE
jgi:hypothetical protein